MKSTITTLVFLIFLGCHIKITESDRRSEELEIMKTVFVDAYEYHLQKKIQIIVFARLYLNKKDSCVDASVLKALKQKFDGTSITFLNYDRLRYGYKDSTFTLSEYAYDSVTGLQGEVCTISEIEWLSNNKIRISYSTWDGPLSSAGYTCVYEKQKGKWILIEDEMDYIS